MANPIAAKRATRRRGEDSSDGRPDQAAQVAAMRVRQRSHAMERGFASRRLTIVFVRDMAE
jgi:hypothetical protein